MKPVNDSLKTCALPVGRISEDVETDNITRGIVVRVNGVTYVIVIGPS